MNRPDFSNFVAHFTKDSPPIGYNKHKNNSVELYNIAKNKAYDRLISILRELVIYSTPMPWTDKKAVAFTECPFWSLVDHATKYSPYGIGFSKKDLFEAGGGPAIYLRNDLFEKQQDFIHKQNQSWKGFHPEIFAFITPFNPLYASIEYKKKWGKSSVDYTHEREWRVSQDFNFKLEQVQFILVKSYSDMAKFPKYLKDKIGREKFVIMDIYQQIERLWPTHLINKKKVGR